MKMEARLLIGVGAFFSITDIVYWFWGYHYLAGNSSIGPEQSGHRDAHRHRPSRVRARPLLLLVVAAHAAAPRGPLGRDHRGGLRGHRQPSRARASGRSSSAWARS